MSAFPTKARLDSIDFHRRYCVHYEPRESKTGCGLDLERPHVAVGDKGMKWGPCIEGHLLESPCSHCPKWERPSLESAEKYSDGLELALVRLTIVDPVISKWRAYPKPKTGRRDVLECPVCKGKLHVEQSSYNGHVRACCETADCVNFIE
ncbi:MAG: hypothetical protein V4662_17855 [Verrucomicrobiota bacterium]